jgi:flagellar motor component MotA
MTVTKERTALIVGGLEAECRAIKFAVRAGNRKAALAASSRMSDILETLNDAELEAVEKWLKKLANVWANTAGVIPAQGVAA